MRRLVRCASTALLLVVPLCAAPGASAEPLSDPSRSTLAPLYTPANAVPGRYIVTLKSGVDSAAVVDRAPGVSALFTYSSALHGFAANLSPTQLEAVRRLPDVEAVEQDGVVTASEITGHASREARGAASSWGLDRIDQRNLSLDGRYNVRGAGAGVTAYIVDTGIDYGHSAFGGRAIPGFDAIGDGQNGQDCNGHGTHVAGTVGGAKYGVARQARLVSVRGLGCNGRGTWSGTIAGFDWVALHAHQPAVLNASLVGESSPAANRAIDTLAEEGVVPVVAAGNDARDACKASPASAERAVTVGASDIQDVEASFSNFGECLWLYAPGVAIVSAKLGGGSTTLDGTSMASPHVAGAAALYRGHHLNSSSEKVKLWLGEQATKGVLNVSKTSPNRLLFTKGL